jgi:thiopeptide-type bacteriocin biosynthesis protein
MTMYRYVDAGMLRLSARASDAVTDWPTLAGGAAATELLDWLNRISRDAGLVAAVEVASPALAARVEQLRVTPDPCPRALRRATLSILRYVLRATSRATPFGLFAGVAPLHAGESSHVVLGAEHKVVARVDHRWIGGVGRRLQGSPGLAGRWAVAVDGRVVTRGGRLVLPSRPSQSATERGSDTDTAEVSAQLSAPVAAVLRYAATPIVLDDLRDRLIGQFPTASAGSVSQLLSGLVAQGFLVTALQPPMTTADPLSHLIGTAASTGADQDPAAAPILADLRSITDLLSRHDANQLDLPTRRELRADAVSRMRAVAGGENPLGFDLRVDAQVTIPHEVTTEAAAAAAALVRLAPDLAGSAQWRDYHRRFLDRYGIGAVVPLAELLHSGSGLGYPAGYRGTTLAVPPVDSESRRRRAELLTRLAHTAAWNRQREVELTTHDLTGLAGDSDVVPQPHTELRVEVHAPTRAALDQGQFRLVVVGASRAVGTVTGRFLDLLDPPDLDRVAHVHRELPTATAGAARTQLSGPPLVAAAGTVSRQPAILPSTATVGGHPPAGTLLPGDLAVSGDSTGLYLLVAGTGQPVEPALFSALELVRCADPMLRFLTEISTALCTPCSPFAWDRPLQGLPFLPRVRYGRSVLAPARWTVRTDDLDGKTGLSTWRQRWHVPDRVLLSQHDQRLRLDLTEPAHQHLLHDTLTRRRHVTLTEAAAADAFGWIDNHAHELVLPLATTHAARHPARPRPTSTPFIRQPRHTPGASEWLYARLGCHPHHQTTVLTEYLPLLLDRLGAATDQPVHTRSAWFLRCTEPDHHLRLRVRLAAPHHFGTAAGALAAWAGRLADAGLLGDLQLDTYRPEAGRFGHGDTLRAAEDVFATDSAAALAQLAHPAISNLSGADPALTAASFLDLVTAFSPTPHDGRQWLITHAPRTLAAPPDRPLRTRALDLAHPPHHALAALPGGRHVLTAWERRRSALTTYRAALLTAGVDPQIVLADLLHLHHARIAGPHLDRESTCLHLARTAALRQLAQRRPAA